MALCSGSAWKLQADYSIKTYEIVVHYSGGANSKYIVHQSVYSKYDPPRFEKPCFLHVFGTKITLRRHGSVSDVSIVPVLNDRPFGDNDFTQVDEW